MAQPGRRHNTRSVRCAALVLAPLAVLMIVGIVTARPARTSSGVAGGTGRCVDRVGWITGPRSASRTDLHWNVHGTDLGHPILHGESLYLVFGDTYGRTGIEGPDWRSNTMARVASIDPADGFEIAEMITDPSGEAAELLPSVKVDGTEKTVIPTYGIGVGDRLVLHYMSVRRWGSPGRWDAGHAGFASSTDDGRTWTVHDERLSGAGNFVQVAMVPQGDRVLVFGIPAGRFGSVRLARARPDELTRPSTFEYWDGRAWSRDPAAASVVVAGPVGELSVRWSPTLERWLMMYFDESRHAVVVRSARRPTGPWGNPRVVTTARQYPQLYAPYLVPGPDRGGDLYFTMSQFGPYQVSLMRLSRSCVA